MAIDISGTVYTDAGVTTMGSGRTVAVSVNGAAAAGTTTTASDGTFTLAAITAASGAVLTIYLQGNTEVGCTVTKSTGSNMTGIDEWQDTQKLRDDNGAALTGTNINTADNNGATGISSIFSSSSNTLFTVASGKNCVVDSGQSVTLGVNAVFTVVSGNFTNNGTLTFQGGTSTITSGNFTNNGTLALNANTITLSAGNFSSTGSITAANATVGTLILLGNFSNTGTFTPTGTGALSIRMRSGGATAISTSAPLTQTSLTCETNAGTVSLGSDFTVTTVTLNNGMTLDASASNYALTVTSNWTNTAGTFTARNGTVTLSGAGGTTQTIAGSTTFYNLSATAAAARTIKFTDGTTQTVSNSLTINGSAGQLITLQGTSTGGWTLACPATQSVSYVNISRCTATGNALLAGVGSVDGGNNVNVTFIPSNSVAPSTAPSSGTTATSYVCSSGTWANTPTTWLWETNKDSAGWVTASTSQNPTLTLAAAGTYQTRLTASNAAGSSSPVAGTTITVSDPAGGAAPARISMGIGIGL